MMIRIREAAVAGSFYPADAAELRDMVQRMVDAARRRCAACWPWRHVGACVP